MAVTVKDVARLAGVSTATVSRAMNEDPRITEATRKRVMACVTKLGYKRNSIALSLKKRCSHAVGFLCPELTNPFFMNVAQGVEEELMARGYSIVICNSSENVEEESKRIRLLVERCVDGVIAISASPSGRNFRELADAKVPLVLVDRLTDDFADCDMVTSDNSGGAFAATRRLIEMGYRNIAFLGGEHRFSMARERYEGFAEAMRSAGLSPNPDIVRFGDYHVDTGRKLMASVVAASSRIDCVFASSYPLQLGAASWIMSEEGKDARNIPFAGFDDMELSSVFSNTRLTVMQPMKEMGHTAAKLLLARMGGVDKETYKTVKLETRIRER